MKSKKRVAGSPKLATIHAAVSTEGAIWETVILAVQGRAPVIGGLIGARPAHGGFSCPVPAALTAAGWKAGDLPSSSSSSSLGIPYCFAPAVLSAILPRSYACCAAAKLVNWSLFSQELGSSVLPHEKDFCTSKHSRHCHDRPSRPTPLPGKEKSETDILYPVQRIF